MALQCEGACSEMKQLYLLCKKVSLIERSRVRFPVEESDFFSEQHQTVRDIYFHIYVQAV